MSEQTITTEQISVKPCIKCGAMDRNKRGACKACARNRTCKYRKANPDYQRNWQKANPEKAHEAVRKWKKANPDKVCEAARKYYHSNTEKIADRMRNWQTANSEKLLENNRRWAKANPEKIKARDHNRRARVKGNGGKLSLDIVKTLMTLQKGKCACCGKSLKQGYHIDHIMPIALGGNNTDDNVQLLTPKCNLSKGAKHPIDFMRSKGVLL